jgi:hypothetical protein
MKANKQTTKEAEFLASYEKGLLILALRDYDAFSKNEEITKMIQEITNKLKL